MVTSLVVPTSFWSQAILVKLLCSVKFRLLEYYEY